MIDKLADLDEKISHLEGRLSDPSLIADQKGYQKVAQEHAHLLKLQDLYDIQDKVLADLLENRDLLKEGDDDQELLDLAREEIEELLAEEKKIEQDIKLLLLPKDPNDERNTFLEIRAGTGGDEAALFVADLYRMYSRYAESLGWKVEVMSSSPLGIGGFKEIIALIRGEAVYSRLKYESGVHRVQRVPETETQGRIHTSAVTVAILPEADEVELNIDMNELKFDVYRASGPGGQSVNTTDSAVRITHLPTGLVVTAQDERSQRQNRLKATRILRSRLLDALQRQQQEERTGLRRSLIGSGDRSQRIRTYNFPQNRVTDHRINLTLHSLERILEGHLDELVEALRTHDRQLRLQALTQSQRTQSPTLPETRQ